MLRKLLSGLSLLVIISSLGCSYTVKSLPLPARPDLPLIQSQYLECLSDEAYSALVERDAKLQAYVKQLEAIIRSTQ